jgi:CheY-specific phosphatase CheX
VPENSLDDALRKSVEEVLEKMFFTGSLPEPVEAGAGSGTSHPGPAIGSRLSFDGDPPGSLVLSVTAAAARSIAADFLASDERELPDRQVEGVVCELANMICGSVLSRVESTTLFRLAAPQIVAVGDIQSTVPGGAFHEVQIPGGVLQITMKTEREEWSTTGKSES